MFWLKIIFWLLFALMIICWAVLYYVGFSVVLRIGKTSDEIKHFDDQEKPYVYERNKKTGMIEMVKKDKNGWKRIYQRV